MKLARLVSGKSTFVAADHSFHGRTIGALSVTHKSMYRDPFMPPVSSKTTFVPYSDTDAIKHAISEDTAAVILEPIQGEGGVIYLTLNISKRSGKYAMIQELFLSLTKYRQVLEGQAPGFVKNNSELNLT